MPGGLDIENLIKTPMIYSVSYFDLGGLSTLYEGISPPNPPVATRLGRRRLVSMVSIMITAEF